MIFSSGGNAISKYKATIELLKIKQEKEILVQAIGEYGNLALAY